MTNPVDDLGNVRIDFAWGNMAMQPNDQRGENTLDPALDNHIIAVAGYEGFPAFIQGPPYDDTLPNVAVPDLDGLDGMAAASAITDAGLEYNTLTTTSNAGGATAENNGLVSTQLPVAGTLVNTGTEVSYSVYEYINPGLTSALTVTSQVTQSTMGGVSPLKGRAYLKNLAGGGQGSAAFLAAATNGLVGKTVSFSNDVAGSTGPDGGTAADIAGKTFTITASSSVHQEGIPGMFPTYDQIYLEWTAEGTNYGLGGFTAGTVTITL